MNLNSLKRAYQSLAVMFSQHSYLPWLLQLSLVLTPGWKRQFLICLSFLCLLRAWPKNVFGLNVLFWLFFFLIYSIFLWHTHLTNICWVPTMFQAHFISTQPLKWTMLSFSFMFQSFIIHIFFILPVVFLANDNIHRGVWIKGLPISLS